MVLEEYFQEKRRIVERELDFFLTLQGNIPPQIIEAMRYSVFAGGKRLRAILSIASAEAVGGDFNKALSVACALELIHAYSLIHDDLPAMDDDTYRRGKLTNHKVFGEAMAILAGDALLTYAFQLLTDISRLQPSESMKLLSIAHEIAKASGIMGMIGGQVVDIQSEGRVVDLPTVHYIHTHKTGALIRIAAFSGALLCSDNQEAIQALKDYGGDIGLAFQIVDDILDIEGDQALLGKDIGSDQENQKATYPALVGLEASKEMAKKLIDSALSHLEIFDEKADPLREIAQFIVSRRS
ncbi:MAG: polyprenyl synthetase family protein [Candidatus Tectomicrobia bacterium]|nr:polyprenyl synthetase family protein [Candidatus Tectomicrobia bacterium]